MAAKLILTEEAEQDVESGYQWYEGRRFGLGEEFLTAVDARLEALRRHPESCPVVFNTFRRALVRRFPYAVFYEYEGRQIIVYGILHTALDPQKWQTRLG